MGTEAFQNDVPDVVGGRPKAILPIHRAHRERRNRFSRLHELFTPDPYRYVCVVLALHGSQLGKSSIRNPVKYAMHVSQYRSSQRD